jgi:photosystem II stability/assembly factor-like uncharacterized protein
MGTTGGGVWKSEDAGVNWKPVSDGFFKTGSVGAIGVSASRPETVYVGMGECDIRGNISPGDGVYRSDDGGKTWAHLGLESTKFIGKIRVHPADPETAWVAALGPVYGPSPERGVFKTTDGGRTWRKVLYEGPRAGAINIALDPSNPSRLFAATWEAWRTPWEMNSGGPGSKLWLSEDGGESWKDVSRRPGLPGGLLGKIGIAISPANPKVMWVIVEALEGGIFRSQDGGQTWEKTSEDRRWRQRAWYYTHVFADPQDEAAMYVLNVGMGRSRDGGKTFSAVPTPHADRHDMWIDPSDPRRMIVGDDGGASVSVDGGRTWTEQDYPTAQMYHVSVDTAFPYNVLGAQQDNSTVRIPSRTRGQGITSRDWTSTAGGESGYVVADPFAPHIVMGGSYGGLLEITNHQTGLTRDISPWPDNPMGSGAAALKERFQWTFPIVFSKHSRGLVYTSSQHVWATTDEGGTWRRISPELTRNDRSKMGPSGGPITKDNTSVEYYGTVFTLAESPVRKGLLWAGSDDGLIHITRDGGRTWKNVTPKGIPEWATVSLIEASPASEGRAWAAVDNHEQDDHRPYIFVTEDFGQSWRQSARGIDPGHFVKAVREDPVNPNLIYAGTEFGFYVSFNMGGTWQRLKANLPVVPIHNMAIAQDDLVLATHGRSFWVLDDLSVLRQAAEARLSGPVLFAPRPANPARFGGSPVEGASAGANPPGGAWVHYWLPQSAEAGKLELLDEKGSVLLTRSAPGRAGLNRIVFTPQRSSYTQPSGFIFWAAGPSPILLPPGRYPLRLTIAGTTLTTTLVWKGHPASSATDKELREQYDLALRIANDVTRANDSVLLIRKVRTAAQGATGVDLSAFIRQLTELEETLHQPLIQSGQDPLNYPIRLNNKLAALLGTLSGEFGPTQGVRDVYRELSGQLEAALKLLDRLMGPEREKINRELKAKGQKELPGRDD